MKPIWVQTKKMLSVVDIRVRYGSVEALKGISLRVEKGEIVTIIGANGAGKTTLMKTLSGMLHPTSGEIWLNQERIDSATTFKIVQMGIAHVPEGRHVFPAMSVIDNLKIGAYSRQDKNNIEKDLEEVYHHFPVLKERRKQAAGTLSGGEQQMLAMGRALMSAPKLLLLDEPSLGLSPLMVKQIARIIKNIHREGRSIILVEQNASVSLRLADRAYVMQTGTITLEGTGQSLLDHPMVKQAYLGG